MKNERFIAELYWVGLLSTVAGWCAILILKKYVFNEKPGLKDLI